MQVVRAIWVDSLDKDRNIVKTEKKFARLKATIKGSSSVPCLALNVITSSCIKLITISLQKSMRQNQVLLFKGIGRRVLLCARAKVKRVQQHLSGAYKRRIDFEFIFSFTNVSQKRLTAKKKRKIRESEVLNSSLKVLRSDIKCTIKRPYTQRQDVVLPGEKQK